MRALVLVCPLLAVACLSPATMRPVAAANRENISNYNRNVGCLVVELESAADLRIELLQYQRRTAVLDALRDVSVAGITAATTDQDLADPAKPWNAAWDAGQQKAIHDIRRKLEGLNEGEAKRVRADLLRQYPVLFDVAVDERTRYQVLRDSAAATELESRIRQETDAQMRDILLDRRGSIADRYATANAALEIAMVYRAAVADYKQAVKEQAQIADQLATSIQAFSDSKPAVDSLRETFQDKDLRGAVVDSVRKARGEDKAREVTEGLDTIDRALDTVLGKEQ